MDWNLFSNPVACYIFKCSFLKEFLKGFWLFESPNIFFPLDFQQSLALPELLLICLYRATLDLSRLSIFAINSFFPHDFPGSHAVFPRHKEYNLYYPTFFRWELDQLFQPLAAVAICNARFYISAKILYVSSFKIPVQEILWH